MKLAALARYLLLFFAANLLARAEDGYRLWLRYEPVADEALRAAYTQALGRVSFELPEGT